MKVAVFVMGMTGPIGKVSTWLHHRIVCSIAAAFLLNRLRWFGHVQRMEEKRIPKRVLYMNLGTTRLRGRPRNRWQDEVREDGRIVSGEGLQEKVRDRGMEEAPENGKKSSNSAHANGMNE
jgi:hypothetical protein